MSNDNGITDVNTQTKKRMWEIIKRQYDLQCTKLKLAACRSFAWVSDDSRVNWLHIKWMRFDKSLPGIMQFKYRLSTDSFSQMDMTAGRVVQWQQELHKLYNRWLCISAAKKKDLISLIHSRIIPQKYSNFYRQLPELSTVDDRLPYPSADETASVSSTEEDPEIDSVLVDADHSAPSTSGLVTCCIQLLQHCNCIKSTGDVVRWYE